MTLTTIDPQRVPGLVLVDHEIEVPLDHADPTGERITVHAREVADPDGRDRPFLLFLQGGPGMEAPRPTRRPAANPGWLEPLLGEFRVLMLDQRGTGRSTPFGGPADARAAAADPAGVARRLTHFRADSIVADAEALRRALGVERWSVLGQSFGGFTALRYLSAAPEGVREALFTGGLPPVGRGVDEIYAATYATMARKSEAYYRRYPGDREKVRELARRCGAGEVVLPDGGAVTPSRLRSIGNALGRTGAAEGLHYLLELDPTSAAFAHDLAGLIPFGSRNPLYALVHESCYADGGSTRWSAERVLPQAFCDDPTLLTGEHLFRDHVTGDPGLAPFAAVADALAEHEWPRLYDADALAACDVPCAAAVYADDAFVDAALSQQTAALLPRMRAWVTNELEHDGIRAGGTRVVERLVGLARDRVV